MTNSGEVTRGFPTGLPGLAIPFDWSGRGLTRPALRLVHFSPQQMAKKYYVTTPIYYVNSVPHVGHALTMLCCDICKRFHQMQGQEAYFLTGTDENGLKILDAAAKAGEDPQAFVDRISQTFADCAESLDIQYDIFFRTTSERHKEASQELFARIRDKGFIYLDKYVGWYDISAETFVKESELVDGKSPDGNEVTWVEEENWFFKLSAFEQPLLAKIESDPNWILPEVRKNEVVSFIKQGLRDICISRSNPGWGIPVPGDESKVIYVWFEALINYLAATGWPNDGYQDLWPADVHWMAKEILTRFHATLWPAMLMALDLPLPKAIVAHGWFVFREGKMSKSKGNVIAAQELISYYQDTAGCSPELSIDVVRYSLAKSLPFEGDTDYSRYEVASLYNSDLANDLGNALNRTISMAHKFDKATITDVEIDPAMIARVQEAKASFAHNMSEFRINRAVESALDLVRYLNKYIDDKAPWALAKEGDPALDQVMKSMIFACRSAEGLFHPIIPATSSAIASQLGQSPLTNWDEIGQESSLASGITIQQPQPMFPRLDKDVLKGLEMEGTQAPAPQPTAEKPKKPQPAPAKELDFADFMNVSLKVARIIEAEPIEGSEKLMKLQVTIGEESRQIVAGIKKKYTPSDLIGRQVVVVANLKPAKLMGEISQGMILAADDADGEAILLQPESEAPEGANVH